MAKAKKKERLSLEEKLEQALVPTEEQPYELPENWCWTYLRNIAQWGSGGTPSRKNPAFYEGNIPWVKTGELEDDYLYDTEEKISDEAIQKSSAKLFPVEAVLIAMYGATIGKTAILGVEATTNQACACAICNESVYNKYLFYYLRSQKDYFIKQGKGGAQPNISQDIIKKNCIPLPPKAEQQRIVEQIESLFAKLDEAKEKIERVLERGEARRDSIMNEAFTGRLTQKLHGTQKENWVKTTIKNVCSDIKVGIVIKPTQYYTDESSGIPAFRSANVRNGYIEDADWVYINEQGQLENRRSEVHEGDVLIVRSGNPGTACVVTEQYNGYNAIDIIIAVPDNEVINSDYLCYYTNSPFIKGLIKQNKRGMALQHFNVGGYSKLPILLPRMEEQKEIVRLLQEIFDREVKYQNFLQSVLKQIDLMKKSILAKAFRGELGTNNPDEENAVELLKRIML